MNTKDLAQRLEVIDAQLGKQKVQLTARPFEAHRTIMAEDGIQTAPFFSLAGFPTIFEDINSWYKSRYGDRMCLDVNIGEKPFLLRGLVYYFRFPLAYGTVLLEPLNFIEGMTDNLRISLTKDEMNYIGRAFMDGYYEFLRLDTFRQYMPKALNTEAQEMSKRGLQDISAAISIFKTSHDAQGAMFHSQQAAEKFLKA